LPVQYPKAKPKTKRPPGRPPLSQRLPSRRVLIAGGAVLAAAIAGILIAVSVSGGSSKKTAAGKAAQQFLSGLPQHGQALGRSGAPVTLVEYGDLQCPFCAKFDLIGLPALAREYVRTGKLRIVLRPIAFIGPDSALGVKATLAAGLQNKLWNLAEVLYANQGRENSGWLDLAAVRRLAAEVPGLDVSRLQRDLDSARVDALATTAAREAEAIRLRSTPTFQIGRTNGRLRVLRVTSLAASGFRPAINRLLGS
jgi:protein-disulfide isomerase